MLLIGLALVGLTVAGMCIFKISTLSAFMYDETEHYLGESAEHIADLVDSRVESVFQALSTAGKAYLRQGDHAEAMELLHTLAEEYSLIRIGVAGMDGEMETTDGYPIAAAQTPVIRAALGGRRAVSEKVYSEANGQSALIYAVPMYRDGRQCGVLAGACAEATVQRYLGVESFSGEGFSAIVNRAGDIQSIALNKNAPKHVDNFFAMMEREGTLLRDSSLERMRADMSAARRGLLYYTLNGVEKTMIYLPLETEDWYLLVVVPTAAAGAEVRYFINLAVIVDVVIVALFLALIALFAWMSRRSQKELETLAYVDPVTGGDNSAFFTEKAGSLISAAPPCTYAMVSMDIEKFKLINDTFGDEMGNRTLAYVHRVLALELQDGELLARVSGDVFHLLLKNEGRARLEARLEQMAEQVNEYNRGRTEKYFLAFFQGVYVIDHPELTLITIRDRANAARKGLKHTALGRLNVCAFYEEVTREQMLREKEIDNRMEEALKNGEFFVELQPKVELRWNTVAGAEALVRWKDPERGLVPPDEFIPLFERNGFVVRLDLYVFEQVCILLRRWVDEGRKIIPISVNLSRVHLEDPGFLDPYMEICKRLAVPPAYIEFELTETTVFENMAALTLVMDLLHEKGFRCSLDDFGSGYSSLNMLKDIPADTIKLDRSFFRDQKESQRGEYVVQSVLDLARRLKIETVCEGVEDPAQLEFLRWARCDMVQGFVFSKPLCIEKFEALAFSGQSVGVRAPEHA